MIDMINEEHLQLVWPTTSYQHAAVYATLTVMATADKKPFTFKWSEKNWLTISF